MHASLEGAVVGWWEVGQMDVAWSRLCVSCACQDGRIAKGDQLLSINGTSLIGISEKRAVEIMMKTGSVVALDVAKNAALFHNLADTLSHPTPLNNRVVRRTSRAARPKSESFTTQVWQERDHAQGSAAHSQVDVLRLLEVEISRLNCRHRSPLEEEQLQNLWIEYQSQLGSQHGAVSQLPLLHHPLPGTAAPRSSAFRPATSMLELSSDTLVTQSQYSHPALQARLGQALPAWSDHSLGPWEQRRHSPEPKQMEVVHLGTSQTRYKSPLHSNSKQRQPQSSPLSFVTSAGAPIGSRERTTHLSPTGEPKPPFQSTIPGINVNMRSDGERHNSLFSVSQHTVPQLKALQSPTYPVHSGLHSGGFNASVKHRRDSKQSLVESQVEMEAPMGSVSYTEPPADPHSAQSPSGLSPDLDPDLAAGGFRPLLFRAPIPQEAERSSPVPASRFSTGFSSTSDGNLNQLLQRGFFEPILNFSKNIDQTLNAVHQGLPTTQTNTDDFNANPYDLQSTVHFVENGSENQCVPILSHLLSPHKQTASPHETGELRNEFPCDCDRLVGESIVEDPPCRPRQQQQQPHEPTGARRHVPGFTGASIGESKGTRRTTCRVIPDVLSSISEEMWPGNAQQSTATELNFSTHIRDSKRNALGVMDAIQKPTHDKIFAVEQTRQLARNVQVSHDDVEVLPMIKNKRDQHANMSAAKESECIDQSPSSTMHKFAADGIKPQFVEMVDMKVQVPGGNEDPSRLSPYWNETKASAGPEPSLTTEGKLPIFRSHGTNYAGPITPQHTTADIADEIKSEVVSDAWTSQRSDAHRKSRSRGLPRVTTETLTLALRETEESWEPQATGHVFSQLPSAAAPFAPQTYQFAAPTEHLQHSQLRVSPEPPSTEPKVGEFSQGNLEISSSLVNSHFEADTKAIGLTNFSSGPSNKFTRYTSSFMEHFIQENIQMTSDQLESKQSPPKFELTRSSEDADSQWHVALMQNNRSPSDYYLDETHTDVEVMFCNNIQQAPEYSSHVKQVDFLPSIEAMDPRGTSERGMTEELSRHPEGLKLSEEVVHSQDARQNEPNKNNSFHPPLRSQLSSQIPFVLPGMQLCSDIKTHADIAFLEETNPGASPQQGDDKPHDVPKGEISNAYANKLEQTADDRVLNNFQLSPVDQTIDTHWENLIHSQLDRYLESPLLDTTSSSSSEVPAVHSLVVPLLPSSLPLPLEAEMFTESAFPPPPSPSSLLVDDSPWVERTTEVGSANECVPCNGGHSHEHPDNVQFSRVTAHALRTYSSAPQDPGEVSWTLGQASLRDGRPMRVVDVREGTARTDLQVLDKRDSFRAQKISGLRLNPSKGSGQHEPRPPVAVKPKSLTSMPQPVVQQSGKFMRSGVYKPHILRKQHSKPEGSADKLSSVGLREIRMGDEHQYSRDSPHHQHPPSPSEAEQDAAPGVETLPFNERLRLFRQRESQRKHT